MALSLILCLFALHIGHVSSFSPKPAQSSVQQDVYTSGNAQLMTTFDAREDIVAEMDPRGGVNVQREAAEAENYRQQHMRTQKDSSRTQGRTSSGESVSQDKQDRGAQAASHNSALIDEALHELREIDPNNLPAWAQAIITGLVMLICIAIYFTVVKMIYNPVPSRADSEKLSALLQETIEKVHQLEDQMETRREVNAMFEADEGEEGEQGEQASAQEREDRERNRVILEAASRLAEQSEKLQESSLKIQQKFGEVMEAGRGHMEDFAKKESAEMYEEVKKAVEEDAEKVPRWEPPSWLTEEGHLHVPPLMQIISGMFATSQIRLTRYFNSCCITVGGILIILSVVVFVVDWKKKCEEPNVWIWHIGFASISLLDIICRCIVVSRCTSGIDWLARQRQDLDKQGGGGGIMDTIADFKRRTASFFDAFFQYHTVTESWAYSLTQFTSVLAMLWGGFGVYVSISDVVPDTLKCQARVALTYMHVYAFLYVILITWQLLVVIVWSLQVLSGSKFVRMPIIQAAKSIDDDSMKGMPIMLSLVQSFVLKDSAEVYSMKARQVLRDIHELETSLEKAEHDLIQRKYARDVMHERSLEAPDEKEFMDRCNKRVMTGLDELKPLVGLIAANVQTTTVGGPDPTAAGSSGLPPPRKPGVGRVHFEGEGEVESY